ncbi:MAG: helix-turn-helix domain-containing protein, partial [Candidatus Binatia bacterium]
SRPITANAHLKYQETVDEYRREVIVKTLQQSNGNRTAAAKLLGLDRAYFQKLLKSFGIN